MGQKKGEGKAAADREQGKASGKTEGVRIQESGARRRKNSLKGVRKAERLFPGSAGLQPGSLPGSAAGLEPSVPRFPNLRCPKSVSVSFNSWLLTPFI